MISKKVIMCVLLAGVLVFGAGAGAMGTRAKYEREFSTNNNQIQSAEFDFGSSLEETCNFEKMDPLLNPSEEYEFKVTGKTEVDSKYRISLKPNGALFKGMEEQGEKFDKRLTYQLIDVTNGNKKIELTHDNENNEDFVDIDITGNNQKVTNNYKLICTWSNQDENDYKFAGKGATLDIIVHAEQNDPPKGE